MKKILIICLLYSGICLGQQGINYKAIISDNGAVVQNQQVGISFTILEGGITEIYKELHVLNTDANGLVITNIGEGITTIGDFATLDWSQDYFLNVEVDAGNGTVDMGTTAFKYVPYALHAKTSGDTVFSTSNNVTSNVKGNVTTDDFVFGDTQLDGAGTKMFFDKSKGAFRVGKTGGTEWDEANIGDYSFASGFRSMATGISSVSMGHVNEASGNSSVAMGFYNEASGNRSIVMGKENEAIGDSSVSMGQSNHTIGTSSVAIGDGNVASGSGSVAMGGGNVASGSRSVAIGSGNDAINDYSVVIGRFNEATGDNSTALGKSTNAESYVQTSLGIYNTITTGTSDSFVATDRLLVLGNGTNDSNRSDAMVILKNGNTTINGDLDVNGNFKEVNALDSGDADMKAYIYGLITGSSGVIKTASSDGFTVTRNSTGSYSVIFNNAPSSYQDYMVLSSIHGAIGFIKTVRNTSHIAVNTYNTSGVLTDVDFNFVVYKK